MKWYGRVLKKYADFTGRARRKEYWTFVLINMFIAVLLVLIDITYQTMVLYYLYTIAIIIPSIAVCVRRLHDTGKSGVYILVSFIPLVGSIIMLILLATEGDHGSNKYGPDPKGSNF